MSSFRNSGILLTIPAALGLLLQPLTASAVRGNAQLAESSTAGQPAFFVPLPPSEAILDYYAAESGPVANWEYPVVASNPGPSKKRSVSISEKLKQHIEETQTKIEPFLKKLNQLKEEKKEDIKKKEDASKKAQKTITHLKWAQYSCYGVAGLFASFGFTSHQIRCAHYAHKAIGVDNWQCVGAGAPYVGIILSSIASSILAYTVAAIQDKKDVAERESNEHLQDIQRELSKDIEAFQHESRQYQGDNLAFFSLVEKYEGLAEMVQRSNPSALSSEEIWARDGKLGEMVNQIYIIDNGFFEKFHAAVLGSGTTVEKVEMRYPDAYRQQDQSPAQLESTYLRIVGSVSPVSVQEALLQLLLSDRYRATLSGIVQAMIQKTDETREKIILENQTRMNQNPIPLIEDNVFDGILDKSSPMDAEQHQTLDRVFRTLSKVSNTRGGDRPIFDSSDRIHVSQEVKKLEEAPSCLKALGAKLHLGYIGKLVFAELWNSYPELFYSGK